MASEDNSDDNLHLDWRDDEASLVNNTYKFESPFDDGEDDDTYMDDEEDDLDGPYVISSEVAYATSNKLRSIKSEDGLNHTHDSLTDGLHHSPDPNGLRAGSDVRKRITISNNAANSAASRFALAQQNYTEADFQFTEKELKDMLDKTQFELKRERRQKQGDVMKSKFIQDQIKNIKFFPDENLNRSMGKLLQKLHYVKEALRVTMYIFFEIPMFKEYYVPSPSGPSGISNNKPFPKYERFHAFWASIHRNDNAFCSKYTKGCIDANSHYRKIALTGGKYTGFVSHRGNAGPSCEVNKSNQEETRNSHFAVKRNTDDPVSSPSKRFQVTLSPTAKSSLNACNSQRTLTLNKINYDSNGRAFYRTGEGETCYVKDENQSSITAEEFFTPSRLLLMKGRANHIWKHAKNKLLDSRDLCWYSGTSDVAKRIKNLSYFPDEDLNELIKKLLFNWNISLAKALRITIYVFYNNIELSKETVPPSPNFEHLARPPVSGYELFHQFWDYLYDISGSVERKKRFESAFSEVHRMLSTHGTIPELPL